MNTSTLLRWGGKWGWLGALLLFSAFLPLLVPPPGLTQSEPIGKFLNGSLPSLTPGNTGGSLTWSVQPVYPNLSFQDPLVIEPHPTQNRIFVASRQGLIESFVDDPNVTTKQTLIDLTVETGVVWDGGFLGFAVHPEFGQIGSPNRNYFYVFYTAKGPNGEHGPFSCSGTCFSCFNSANFFGSYLRLARYEVIDGTLTADPASELQMINIRQYNGTHRGGGLTFGNDGFLYLTIGDQARYAGAQNLVDNFEGGVIRIDVDQQGGSVSHAPRRRMGVETGSSDEFTGVGYYVPNDNPWLDVNHGQFEEFVSIGHRAPHRMTLDPATGDLWIGEVGQSSREEINRVQIGGNGGWPIYEGNLFQQMNACNSASLPMGPGTYTAPVTDFLRSEARAIIGGYVYRGSHHPSLYGQYLCGGYALDRIFTVDPATGNKSDLTSFTPGSLITWGQDQQGEILMGRQAGSTTLYTLVSSGGNAPAPQFLSQTGAFSDLTTLTPNPGVIPYDMIQDFWSDRADKQRWLAVPNDNSGHDTPEEQIQWSENGPWQVPNGTVLIKHFELAGLRLETRFEVRGDDGEFYYLTYKWNAAQTDAELLTTGLDETITVNGQSQVWHYPSPAECRTCHNQTAGHVLGLRTRYLNRDLVYPQTGLSANQLVTLSHVGILDQPITATETPNYLTIAAMEDTSASLAYRARSYLDLNCAYCHQPGSGNRAVFDARITTDLADQNLIYGPLSDPLGNPNAWTIVPQDVPNSMIHHRMNSTLSSVSMPPLAKNVIDSAGVQLIADWINSLPATPPPSDLFLNGDAVALGAGCYQLTATQTNQLGTAWYPGLVDLSQHVNIRFFLNLGANDGGADGATFLFHTQGYGYAGGTGGGGLGAQGTQPSVGVEFDTWNNGTAQDLADDHVAIWTNGNLPNPVATAVCLDPACANVEDGVPHQVDIQWRADSQLLRVWFDGTLRNQYTGDLVGEVFGGNPFVNAGLTAATGGATNQQVVCDLQIDMQPLTPPNQPPLAEAGSDQTLTDTDNDGQETVSLDGSGSSDSDGSLISYAWSQEGSTLASGVSPSLNLPVGEHLILLTVMDSDSATATDSVRITIEAGPPAPTAPPVVLYRVNAGGVELAPLDTSMAWEKDTRWDPSQYLSSDPSGHRASNSPVASIHASVDLSTTPPQVFDRERWDRNGGDDITYRFPVPTPGDYEVRVYLLESDASMGVGNRVFSIALEGDVPPSGSSVDLFAEYGPQVGAMKSFVVSVSDGTLNVALQRQIGNPLLSGLEIIGNPGGSPPPGQPDLVVDQSDLRFEADLNGTGHAQLLTLSNPGEATLYNLTASLAGAEAAAYNVSVPTGTLDSLPAGGLQTIEVTFAPTTEGIAQANLTVVGDDVAPVSVNLHGLGYAGEPSLQRLLAFTLGANSPDVGDDDASTAEIHSDPIQQIAPLLGDEVPAQVFLPADASQPVETELLAVYPGGGGLPTLGWHDWDDPASQQPLFDVLTAAGTRSVSSGSQSFRPNSTPFAWVSSWPDLSQREVFGIDSLNTFPQALPHQVRVYPLAQETHAYVVAVEAETGTPEHQSLVFVARNVVPTSVSTPPLGGGSLALLYRINAGGLPLTAIDGEMDWEADTRWSPTPYLASDPSGHRTLTAPVSSMHSSVDPAQTPIMVFDRARWDRGGGDEITYEFPVSAGDYEVRVYLAEPEASMMGGGRQFSIAIEGTVPASMSQIDLAAEYGPLVGAMKRHTVSVSDGSLGVQVLTEINSPQIHGLEILEIVPSAARRAQPKGTTAEADPWLRVYPNPLHAADRLWLEWRLPEAAVLRWRLLDSQGRLLNQGHTSRQVSGQMKLSLAHLSPGLYWVQIHGENWQQTRRVLLLH